MTKVFCDICELEKPVKKRDIVTRVDCVGNPITHELEVCNECYDKIVDAQVKALLDIRTKAKLCEKVDP